MVAKRENPLEIRSKNLICPIYYAKRDAKPIKEDTPLMYTGGKPEYGLYLYCSKTNSFGQWFHNPIVYTGFLKV